MHTIVLFNGREMIDIENNCTHKVTSLQHVRALLYVWIRINILYN